MFDIGWSELLIIVIVALIVVGPKDLPKMFRTLGQISGKLRSMAREFTRAMENAADEAGMRDLQRTLKDAQKTVRQMTSSANLGKEMGFDEIERSFRDIGHNRPAVRPALGPGASPGQNAAAASASTASTNKAEGSAPGATAPAPDLQVPQGGGGADLASAAARGANPADSAQAVSSALSPTEAERLKRAERAAEARRQASEIRARRAAAAQANAQATGQAGGFAGTVGKGPASAAPASENPNPTST